MVANRMGKNSEESTQVEDNSNINDESKKMSKRKKNIIAGSIVSGIVIVGVIIFFWLLNGLNSNKIEKVLVPNLNNMTPEQARISLENIGLIYDKRNPPVYELSDEIEAGRIISNSHQNETVEKGTEIQVIISRGKEIEIEDYRGKSIDEVKPKLEALGIQVFIREESNNEVNKGIIINQSIEAGMKIQPDAVNRQITLTVSLGFRETVPNVVGLDLETARNQLETAGFVVSLETLAPPTSSNEIANMQINIVINQSVSANTVVNERNTRITLRYYNYKPSISDNTNNNNDNNSNNNNQDNGDDFDQERESYD
jgi:Uncharacterized protein conserved in bacteria